jgi:hypothetical protein
MCSGWRWDTQKFTLLSYFVVMFAGSFELSVDYFNVLFGGSFEMIVDFFKVLYFCLFCLEILYIIYFLPAVLKSNKYQPSP